MLRLLLETSADAASPVVVLATMRSDFLNAFQLFPGAANRYEEVTLDPMPKARFGVLIVGPGASALASPSRRGSPSGWWRTRATTMPCLCSPSPWSDSTRRGTATTS